MASTVVPCGTHSAALRPHVAAFYAFVRSADDIADNPELAPAEKVLRLERFEAALTGPPTPAATFPKAEALRASLAASGELNAAPGADLDALITQDRKRATEMHQAAEKLREELEAQQIARAKDAFQRLDLRLSRLVNRARLGRIETVLGKKRALEIEVQALSQGLLPQTIVDSLRAERYLGSNEEYWPFEGEDWADEYVGGEGLR